MGIYRGYGSGDSAASPTGQASQVDYDNSTSGLTADDVQSAIDELENEIDALQAADVSLDSRLDALEAAPSGGADSGLAGLTHNILGSATYDSAGNIAVLNEIGAGGFSTAIPGTASNFELSSVYAQPFAVVETMTFERMGCRISTYNPALNDCFVRYLIWEERSATDRRPGTLIYDSGAFELPDTTAPASSKDLYAWHTFSSPIEFEAGKQYWIGYVFTLTSGNAPSVRVVAPAVLNLAFHLTNDNGVTRVMRVSGASSNPSFSATTGDDSSDYGAGGNYVVFAFQT